MNPAFVKIAFASVRLVVSLACAYWGARNGALERRQHRRVRYGRHQTEVGRPHSLPVERQIDRLTEREVFIGAYAQVERAPRRTSAGTSNGCPALSVGLGLRIEDAAPLSLTLAQGQAGTGVAVGRWEHDLGDRRLAGLPVVRVLGQREHL